MKITTVNIPADETVGLQDIKMSKLSNLVLVAGKNGSGKSRLLTKIKNTLQVKPTISQKAQAQQNIPSLENTINNANKIGQNTHSIPSWTQSLNNSKDRLNWNLIETNEEQEQYVCFDFVPKQLGMQDPHSLAKQQIEQHALQIQNIDIGAIQNQAYSAIQHIQDQWFNATHPVSSIPEARKLEIVQSYVKLCDYIELFLDTKLDRNENNDATLFGFRLGDAKLSDGQKILLQFCMAIYSKETKISDLILMLDEPENHLHPEALVGLIDRLVNAVSNGQIWIATHSINLLAHFDPSNIWYIEEGKVSYAGNKPKTVLDGLLGRDDEIHKLSNFLSLPALMATNQFAFECLFEPQSVSTGNNDPQTNQIIASIESLINDNNIIKVLDFGAGKGRLLSTIRELNSENNIDTKAWLDYYAFDLPSTDNDVCKNIIDSVYDNDQTRIFNDEKTLIEEAPANSFDMIILCNVFHEIDAKDWLNFFNEHSIFAHALKEDGILLIVEDQLLAVGEKAYQNGFMVLDKIQFRKLFNINEDYLAHDARSDGRLKAHYIKKQFLRNVTSTTRTQAIESLLHTSQQQILHLRSPSTEQSYKNGKLHGFWVQQLANAQLALGELGSN